MAAGESETVATFVRDILNGADRVEHWQPIPSFPVAVALAQKREGGRSLNDAVDDARKASIVDDVKLPSAATKAIRAYASLRRRADEEDRRAARAARRAVRVLRTGKLKMSARDAARLLGLSHQRVHQLTQEGTR
jgi:hypothetical protein